MLQDEAKHKKSQRDYGHAANPEVEVHGEFRIRRDPASGRQVDVDTGKIYPADLDLKEVRGSGERSHFRYVKTKDGGMFDTKRHRSVFPIPVPSVSWLCLRYR